MVLLAAQGKNWALMVLLAQLGMVFVGLVMLTLSLVSDLMAHALYKRRLVAQKSSPQMAREIDHVHAGLESSESIRNNASQTSEGDNV